MSETDNLTPHRMQKLAAIIFISFIAISFLSGFDVIKSKVRDIKRRADIMILVKALDLYHDKFGKYPDSIDDWQGWDLSSSYNGGQENFISKLREENFIDRMVKDPINNAAYHYRYQKYNAGDYGCPTAFYILQAVNFELLNENNGRGECPELNWAESSPNGYTAQNMD